MKIIKDKWDKFYQLRFPKGYGGTDVNGICVTYLDSQVAGCISTYVNYGSLNNERIKILVDSEKEFREILGTLSGEALEYFSLLHELRNDVLKELN